MGLESFSPNESIFEDENALRDNYQPDELLERDEELGHYQSALRPVINGARPKNVFLYGETGVGKTLATQMVLDRLRKDQRNYQHLDLQTISLVCKSMNSSYQVAINLVNEFRDPHEEISTTGYPASAVYDVLWTHFNSLDATHCLIVLDEIDAIGTDDDILYELPRCNDNGNVEDTWVGVVGISNDFTFRDNLSAHVKDSLCDEEIHFPPYDANQLRNILYQRAEDAFHDDVLEDDVIPLAAAQAAQKSGSARQALKRLYKAGDIARDEGATKVTERHVREADEQAERDKVQSELSNLPTQAKLAVYALLQLENDDETPAKRSHIYERYTVAAKRIDANVVSDRAIHDNLSHLTLKGFLDVNERNEGLNGGSYYEYEFNIRSKIAEDALKNQNRTKCLPY